MDIPEVFIIEVSIGLSLAVGLLNQPDGVAHDARHAMRLLAVAGAIHGGEKLAAGLRRRWGLPA